MPYHMTILYFRLPYFHSISVLSFYIDVVSTLSVMSRLGLSWIYSIWQPMWNPGEDLCNIYMGGRSQMFVCARYFILCRVIIAWACSVETRAVGKENIWHCKSVLTSIWNIQNYFVNDKHVNILYILMTFDYNIKFSFTCPNGNNDSVMTGDIQPSNL